MTIGKTSTAVKRSFYFPAEMLAEIIAEAARIDRPLSWIMQLAWERAREGVRALPSANAPTRVVRDERRDG